MRQTILERLQTRFYMQMIAACGALSPAILLRRGHVSVLALWVARHLGIVPDAATLIILPVFVIPLLVGVVLFAMMFQTGARMRSIRRRRR